MGTVKEKYGFLPTSVLHFGKTRSLTRGYLGDQSWRKENDDKGSGANMSEFNPDLCKFIIECWSEKGDVVLDPFHGWGTRCAITNQLKRNYIGYDISKKTSDDVKRMMAEHKGKTKWFQQEDDVFYQLRCEDGIKVASMGDETADLVFSCPPYFDIEEYEDIEGQLSSMDNYEVFMKEMHKGAKRYYDILKDGKYCVMVIGDWRVNGQLRMFSKDMIDAFCQAGFLMHDYLIHKLNSMSVIGCGNFDEKRHVAKCHEIVLVFKKDKYQSDNIYINVENRK